MVVGECYKYDISMSGDAVEINLYENREGKEKAFEWGIAGEVIAKRVKKIGGVIDASYSASLGKLTVRMCRHAEGIEGIVKAIMDIASEVLMRYRTPLGKAEAVLKEMGLQPA